MLAAPNSYGKSTLLHSIVYALGLEGMFSSSHSSPLGPAMTTVVDLPGGQRAAVVESFVQLVFQNSRGDVMRVRRYAGGGNDNRLIQTWTATSVAELSAARRVDSYVRTTGSASRELGFHHILAQFLGWKLPMVPSFRGGEVLLYLEALFPLFYVEQKRGWGGITPRMPTYLGIRDMLRRSVEYVLGLSTLERLRQLNALKEELAELKKSWALAVERASLAAGSQKLRIILPATIEGRASRGPSRLEALIGESWVPVSSAISQWRDRLSRLQNRRLVTSGERTEQSRQDLDLAERDVRRLGIRLRTASEQVSYVEADLDALASRLSALEADRVRLLDLRRMRDFGSDLGVPILSNDLCPTCFQPLDDRHVDTGQAATLDETLTLSDAERITLRDMQRAADLRLAELTRVRDSVAKRLEQQRSQVRLLRDELVAESAAPSLVEVQEQLVLRDGVAGAVSAEAVIAGVDEELDDLAERYDDVRARIQALEKETESALDFQILATFNRLFRDQLTKYGLFSLPVDQVSIDSDTLVPTNEGVELSFDLALGMSASDTIRTKWAYYVALMMAASSAPNGHHLQMLMFDEPRQQETAKLSMEALIAQLGVAAASGNQVIYATSEDRQDLDAHLVDIPHTRLQATGSHLLAPVNK